MKRIISLVLCLILCLSLCACNQDAKAIEAVETAINAIGTVTADSEAVIAEARAAYDGLEEDLKAQVTNYDVLEAAEKDYKYMVNQITNYKSVNCYRANYINTTATEWYSDGSARATLFLMFYLDGYDYGYMDADDLHIGDQYVGLNTADKHIDIYAPYGDGKIMGIQYWPSKRTAQVGTVVTDMDIEEYMDMMVEYGVVDKYKHVPLSDITYVMNLVS